MRKEYIIVSLLLLLTFAVYVRTVGHAFIIWDDDKNITENELLIDQSLEHIHLFWINYFQGLFIPITYTVWGLLAFFSGSKINPGSGSTPIIDPTYFPLLNDLIHVANVGLVILLIYRLLGKRDLLAATFGAAVFALHPMQVESVAWATGLKDVLSTFFALISILVFLRYREIHSEGRHRYAWTLYGLSLLVYTIGLLTKPSLVVIPVVLVALEYFLLDGRLKRVVTETAPFFVLALACVVVTKLAQSEPDKIFHFVPPPVWHRPFVAMDALSFYVSKLFYPFMLVMDYGRKPPVAFDLARQFPIWIFPVVVFLLILRIRRHRNFYFFGFALALVSVGPVLGIIPFGFQAQSTVADRYFYFAMVGIALAVATWLTNSESRAPRIIVACAVPVLAALSYVQVSKWETSKKIFEYTIAVNPKSVAATYNLGLSYSNDGLQDVALSYYHRVLDLKNDFANPWNNIGFILNTLKRPTEAIPYLKKAIEADPEYSGSRSNLGIAYSDLGDYEGALRIYREALLLEPSSTEIKVNIAVALTSLGTLDEALRYFQRASIEEPTWYQPYAGMVDVYVERRDYAEAISVILKLIEVQPGNPANYKDLAMAYALTNQFPKAIPAAETGIEVARAHDQEAMEKVLAEEASLYRQGIIPEAYLRQSESPAESTTPTAPAAQQGRDAIPTR
ncbi:MAG: tetratricopeptide repeat protein [Verrucomicrobiales bacterium]